MPPSSGDLANCTMPGISATTQRIVDGRGVWEFQCDEKHPFFHLKRKAIEKARVGLENITQQYGLELHDRAWLHTGLKEGAPKSNPTDGLQKYLWDLESKYPGIYETSQSVVNELTFEIGKFAEGLLENDQWSLWLLRHSSSYSDEELAIRIRNYITQAEKQGVYMSYTPFREMVPDIQEKMLKEE